MAWLRVGDTFSTHPLILALIDPAEPFIGSACKGFFLELAALSANALTDYEITQGFINLAGGAAAPELLKRCKRAGLITDLGGRGNARRWKLIDTAPELIHIRLKAEVSWERQQKADTGNPLLRAAAYLRDGDACRYCGVVVQPADNMSPRGKTLDHVHPGQQARTAEDLVVCCRRCNGRRGKDWQDEENRPGFAARWPLRRPPSPLLFVRSTVTWLEKQGHSLPPGSVIAERAPKPDSTPTTSDQEATRPATQAGAAAPGRSTTAPKCQHSATQVDVAAPDASTTGATRPASQAGAAAPAPPADQHPASPGVAAANSTAPECQHPAPAGVAAPESRTDRSPTDRSRTADPGRVGSGRGGAGGSPPTPPARADPPDPPQTQPNAPARRTRRGRRRPRTGGPA